MTVISGEMVDIGTSSFMATNADTPRTQIARSREFDVEDFRKFNGATRSDFAAFRAMIDKVMTLATAATPQYSVMRFSGDYGIGGGYLFPNGFPTGCGFKGYGRRKSRLFVSANDGVGLGNIINTRGAAQCDIGDFAINYDPALTTPSDYAIVLDDGAEQFIERVAVYNAFGHVLVGRTGNVNRASILRVFGAVLRGSLGGDHFRVQWASSLDVQRLRCNTDEEMTGAFYRFAPTAGGLVDTFKLIDCQGQNGVHDGYDTGDGMVFDCTYGNVYSGTLVGCIVDHTFGRGVAYVSEPYSVAGVPQKTSIRNIQHVHTRNTADYGPSRYFSHQGAGRMSQIGEVAGYSQISVGEAVKIAAKGAASYFEAPNFTAFNIRSTARGDGSEVIPNVFDVSQDMRFQIGTIARLGESDITMPKLGIVRGGAKLLFTGNSVDNVTDPTFDLTAAGAGSIINSNWGMAQVAP